jgi:hypothetical protein
LGALVVVADDEELPPPLPQAEIANVRPTSRVSPPRGRPKGIAKE